MKSKQAAFKRVVQEIKNVIYNPPQRIELQEWQVDHLATLGISTTAIMMNQVNKKNWFLTATDLAKVAIEVGREQGRLQLQQEQRQLLGIH